ncbi:MAG TPA: hypothetical protein VFZ65_15145 [Planctomycetota bacterium]|nr:hypothetical protein [Planctomycetota bacterium]
MAHSGAAEPGASLRTPMLWGVVFGGLTVVAPLGFWWLDQATVHALSISLITAVYIGFAVADGRPKVLVVETIVAALFVVLAAAAVTETAWLLVVAYFAHGVKDLWQHRTQFVANTRWWPPFCVTVDWLVAAVLVVEIAAGVAFRSQP